MLSPDHEIANRLLAKLGKPHLQRLLPLLEEVSLGRRQVLEVPGRPIASVYFIETGLVSVIASSRPDRCVLVGMIGPEGTTGHAAILDDDRSSNQTVVYGTVTALRLSVDDLKSEMHSSSGLRRSLLHFVHVFMAQASQTLLATACANLDERLARWILMSQDRFEIGDLSVTHENLALFLGVRRPAITLAVHFLEGRGLIKSTRSLISVVDREGLQKQANGSYGVAETEYARLFGGWSKHT
jgi:CRP-like cAMP-binding protein